MTNVEVETLRRELHDAYETLRAIHEGEVDAFVTKRHGSYTIESLVGADTPYRVFVESMRDGAVTVSQDGVILYCNRPFAVAVGMEPSEIVGLDISRWIETDVELEKLFGDATLAEAQADATLRCAAGTTPVGVTVCALPGDDASRVFCLMLNDLTDRIAARELRAQQVLLARQRAELEGICSRLPFALLLAESVESFSYINPAAEAVLERYPALRISASAAAAKALAGTRAAAEETSLPSQAAPPPTFRVQAIPLKIEGSMRRALVVIEDITIERETQRTRERQDHFREVFVGVLGHDLRTPLMAITNAVQVLRIATKPAQVTRATDAIQRASARMQRLIDDILDLTRSRIGGGIPLARWRLNLEDVVKPAVQELEAAAPEVRVDLRSTGDTTGDWDGSRLTQVVTNLLNNAVKHGARGRPLRVAIDGADDHWVTLSVHNEGEPIPAEVQPWIFDPFRQGAQSAARRDGGIGLGLYIAERIVAAHAGTIAVHSTAAEGTTFTVTLPRRFA